MNKAESTNHLFSLCKRRLAVRYKGFSLDVCLPRWFSRRRLLRGSWLFWLVGTGRPWSEYCTHFGRKCGHCYHSKTLRVQAGNGGWAFTPHPTKLTLTVPRLICLFVLPTVWFRPLSLISYSQYNVRLGVNNAAKLRKLYSNMNFDCRKLC